MGLTYDVAKFVLEKGYRDFSKDDVQAAKNLTLDGIGAMVSGSRERVSQAAIQFAKECGGVGECGVVGDRFKTSVVNAGLINGITIHANELEAIGSFPGTNPMSNIPVALGLGEKMDLSGKSVIEGIILGLEVQTKLGVGGPGAFDRGFSSVPMYGSLGAAATAGKMIDLSVAQMQNAFGIAIAQCSGLQRNQGSMTHLLDGGIACRNGVTSALLAKKGVTAEPDLIEGRRGFFDLFSADREYSEEKVLTGLGNPYCVAGIFIKKYGCCFHTHRPMEALIQLLQEHAIGYDDIAKVKVEIPRFAAAMLRFHDPQDGEEATFSMEQSLGAILVDRKVELPYLRPFTDAGAVDPRYREARKKIEVIERSDWTGGRASPYSEPVTVLLKSGAQFTKAVAKNDLKGGGNNPLSWDELVLRHEALCKGFLSDKQLDRSVELVGSLESLDSIAELMHLLTFGQSS